MLQSENCLSPVIAISQHLVVALSALGALLVLRWILRYNSYGLSLAKAVLKPAPWEKIAFAWVLIGRDGPRSIPIGLMPFLGATFPEGYVRIGVWQTAEGAGGYAASCTQELYELTARNETLKACQALREKENE